MKITHAFLEQFITAHPDSSVIAIANKMKDTKMRHIYIINGKEKLLGVISLVDINNKIVAEGKSPHEIRAKDVMSSPVWTVDSREEAKKAYLKMVEHKRYTMPVVRNGKIIGIVNMTEMIRLMVKGKRINHNDAKVRKHSKKH